MKDFKWENLQKTARKRGQLVYAFDQERPVEKQDLTVPDNGYCVGLTLRWIALRFAGKDYEYNAKGHLGLRADYRGAPQPVQESGNPGRPVCPRRGRSPRLRHQHQSRPLRAATRRGLCRHADQRHPRPRWPVLRRNARQG